MLKISDTYKELGIAFELPIKIKDENDNVTYFENSKGHWYHREYDANGNVTYYESSSGYWCRNEYDGNGKNTHYENSNNPTRETPRSSCAGKVIEVDGKKYKLTEV